jgi:endo-1,4-beta-xylanase
VTAKGWARFAFPDNWQPSTDNFLCWEHGTMDMGHLCRIGFVVLALVAAGVCAAAEQQALPTGGKQLFEDATAALGGPHVAVQGPGFTQAAEVTSPKRGEPWDVQSGAPINTDVARGDVLMLQFWARVTKTTDESGQGFLWCTIGEGASPYRKSLETTVAVGRDWEHFMLPCACRADYRPGQINISFGVGQAQQTIQIGGVELISYDHNVALGDLPRTRPSYAGRGPDAPWRAEAQKRIEEVRMAPFSVRVEDADGRPVQGAEVHVQMTRHAFQFGCAVTAFRVANADDPANAAYCQKILELFNAGSFGNILKWPAWNGDWGAQNDRAAAMKALKWWKDHGLAFRGHVLVWPAWMHLPSTMQKYKTDRDAAAIEKDVLAHIDEETKATAGYVQEWDVCNEPYTNHDLMDICGKQVLVEWFKRAHEDVPDVRLALNDYGILTALNDDPHMQDYEDNIRYLLDSGAPLGVLGIQGHFGGTVPPPTRMVRVLERYAKFGLPFRITEFTIGGDDDELKSDFTRDAMTVVFSEPSAIGFQFWGMEQLVRRDGTETPMCAAYRDLVFGKWWTDVTGKAGADAAFSGRGFLGSYKVTVTANGKTATKDFELKKGAEPVVVKMP